LRKYLALIVMKFLPAGSGVGRQPQRGPYWRRADELHQLLRRSRESIKVLAGAQEIPPLFSSNWAEERFGEHFLEPLRMDPQQLLGI